MACTLVTGFITGCGGGEGTGDAGTGDAGMDAGWKAPFDPAVCGMQKYSWLDPAGMGAVKAVENVDLYSLDKDTIKTLLLQYGYDFLVPQYGSMIYKFRYVTQDRGKPVEATAMMAIPMLEKGQTLSAPSILWVHGTCGYSDNCAASNSAEWTLPMVLMASQGYIGVAPDYIGMNGMGDPSTVKHPYMVGEATAIASLDALRASPAVLNRLKSKVSQDLRYFIWGASQGGHATLFTELYTPYYAPASFNLIGALALIPPASLVAHAEAMMKKAYDLGTPLAAMYETGMARWYGYDGKLSDLFVTGPSNDFSKIVPEYMDSECGFSFDAYGVKSQADLFSTQFIDSVSAGSWATSKPWYYCVTAENSIGLTSVKRKSSTPIYYVTAEKDELIPIEASRKAYDEMCAAGYSMNYLECKDALHTPGGLWSMPEQFMWANDRLAGKPLSNPCVRTAPVCCEASGDGCK
jgi:predicted esterase